MFFLTRRWALPILLNQYHKSRGSTPFLRPDINIVYWWIVTVIKVLFIKRHIEIIYLVSRIFHDTKGAFKKSLNRLEVAAEGDGEKPKN